MQRSPLTDSEISTITKLLKKLEPGALPFDIFHQLARITALPIIETVPLRRRNGKTEVLLLAREANDPIWPGALHVPGTVLRGSDQAGSFNDAFGRINKEMQGATAGTPVHVMNILNRSNRGLEASAIYWIECLGEVPGGTFYPAEKLPEELVDSQRQFISRAVRAFEKSLV